jgi:alkylation response protein AidB-like acyl-CoA dehydrogenase
MGIKASNTAEVYFEDCPIPAENLLGGKIVFRQTENTRFSFPHR